MIARFSDVTEFLQEVDRDSHLIARGIVRLTRQYIPSKMAPNIRYLTVVATAQVGKDIVRFEKLCGEIWGGGFEKQDAKYQEIAQALIDRIEGACKEFGGLEVRPGVLEEGETNV